MLKRGYRNMLRKASYSVYISIKGLVCREENLKKRSRRLDFEEKKADFRG